MSADGQVEIRPPALIRAYVVAFTAFWIGPVAWTTMIKHHGLSIAIGVVFIAFEAVLASRSLRLGVRSAPDGTLTIRNNLGSRRLAKGEIQEFRIASNGGIRLGQTGIQALLRDGTLYGLDVGRAAFGFARPRLAEQLDELNRWLHAGY